MDVPIEIRNRPFSIEPNTLVMMPDGIFDTSLMFQDISFFVTNRSEYRLKMCWVRPDHASQAEWTYTAYHMVELGPMEPGESRLIRWRANFSRCTPGKKELRIEFGCQIDWVKLGGGFDGYMEKRIFVSRTSQTLDKNKFICEVPEGKLQLTISEYSLVPSWTFTGNDPDQISFVVPAFPVIEKIVGSTSLRPGLEDALPFQDPWWKIVAWIVAALAAIGAFIAAKEGQGTASVGVSGEFDADGSNGNWCLPDPTKHPDKENVAGILSIIATAAIRVGMMDIRDPWQKGRDKFPNDPGDPRQSETVTAQIEPPDELKAGAEWEVPISWEYTSQTRSGQLSTEARREVGCSENGAGAVNIDVPNEVPIGENITVKVYIEHQGGQPLLGDEMYGFANFISPKGHVFRRELRNKAFADQSVLKRGGFEAGINTEWAGGQIGWDNARGKWTIELYGQLVNRAPEGIDPFEAATFVGGDVMLSPFKLTKSEPGNGDVDDQGGSKCQPDDFLESHVL